MEFQNYCLLLWFLLFSAQTSAEDHHHHIDVQTTPVKRLCDTHKIILYNCSTSDTVILSVSAGETNLYWVINAAMNTELSIAGHLMTVVATDASYTKQFNTSEIMLGPGQTTDVHVTMDQPARRYCIAVRAYPSAEDVVFDNTTTTAILEYKSAACSSKPGPAQPAMPSLPAFNEGNRSPRKAQKPPRRAALGHKRARSQPKAPTQGTLTALLKEKAMTQ
ncbi:putative laccase-17 [Acorus calamus]|uniref:Laccase-17 n=1 Tax=Acorus calamus TaxID=4465 RepID=A0AAV9CBJ5_ACOCL|nr:putative laccase-17 [Acorus calamus]